MVPAMKSDKYPKEVLEPLVKQAESVSHVMRLLGHTVIVNSIHRILSKLIKQYNLDTSHFKKAHYFSGLASINNSIPPQQLLVYNKYNGSITSSDRLRKALIAIGRPYVCVKCNLLPIWNNEPLTLQVDHINAIRIDNRPDNLRFMCPNCHTQTLTWGKVKTKPIRARCLDCSKEITKKADRCRSCALKLRLPTKIMWPSINEIVAEIKDSSCSAVARRLGVTDNAVRKHLKARGTNCSKINKSRSKGD